MNSHILRWGGDSDSPHDENGNLQLGKIKSWELQEGFNSGGGNSGGGNGCIVALLVVAGSLVSASYGVYELLTTML